MINGDVWTDFPLHSISLDQDADAHLVMVANPEHNPSGDFAVANSLVSYDAGPKYTFSGISLFRPQLFAGFKEGCFPLRDVLRPAILSGRVAAELYPGSWCDVGTVERYQQLQTFVNSF